MAELWHTVFGIAMMDGENDWRRCWRPGAQDVPMVAATLAFQPPRPPIHVLKHMYRLDATNITPWVRTLVQSMVDADAQVIRLCITCAAAADGTVSFLRLQMQLHSTNFDAAMTSYRPFTGFATLCKCLGELGPRALHCLFDPLGDYVNGDAMDATHAILPLESVWKLPLLPAQQESLLWMQCFEAMQQSQGNHVECPLSMHLPGTSYNYCFFNNAVVPTSVTTATAGWSRIPFAGGILADPVGTGKTAVILALVVAQPRRLSDLQWLNGWTAQVTGSSSRQLTCTRGWMDVASHVPTHASLIIVPNNLCKQWVNEVEKFVMPGALKVVRVFNKRDFDATHMKALQDADVVITTLHFLNGPVYRKYLAEKDVSMLHRYYGAHGRSGTLSEVHPVFFQAFLWRRVIFDEQHELVVTRTLAHLLQGLKAEVYWGITATPSLHRNNFIFHLDPTHIGLFPLYDVQLIRHAVRRTQRTEARTPVIAVNHVVPLLDRERAMLEAYRNRGLEALIQLTTCFNVVALFGASAEEDEVVVTMTFDEVARVMVAKHDVELGNARQELAPLREQLQGLMQHLSQAGVEDAAAGEGGETHTGLARLLHRQVKLCRRRVEKKEAELQGLEQQRQFFHSQLVQRQVETSNCPICFEDGANVVTECGHWFCKQCINSYFRTGDGSKPCPVCKHALDRREYIEVASRSVVEIVPSGGASVLDLEQQYGSKLAAMVRLLREIKGRGEKAIMFFQWTTLMRVVKRILVDGGVQACGVFGNMNMVNAALHKFQGGEADVLMLSLETSTAGLNLVEANHIIFAHALVNVGHAYRKNMVDQAVGRVNRLGQTRDVHVHWFISENTDEQRVFDTYARV
jgi:hypothetical protein